RLFCARSSPFQRAHGLFFEVQIDVRAQVHRNAEDRATFESARRLVFLAHGIPAVVADAEAIARQRELARLRAHAAFRYGLVVHIQSRLAKRLSFRTSFLPDEFHAERVLARLEFCRDKLLLRLDPEKIVNVVQLAIFEEEAVAAKSRAVRED